jgi:hypothetical protein
MSEKQPSTPRMLPFQKPEKRSKGWAVVRAEAPVMPWEEPDLMPAELADAMARMAAVRGSVVLLGFWADCMELYTRLADARGEGAPLHEQEAKPIITGHYYELVELNDKAYGQRFLRLWLCLSDFLVAKEKGRIARRALKRQINRVARR